MERRHRICSLLDQRAKLAQGFVVHSGSIQRAGQLATLERTRIAWQRGRGSLPSHRQQEVRVEQAVQRFAHLEFAQPGIPNQTSDVAMSVDERKKRFLFGRQWIPIQHQLRPIDAEYDVEAGEFFLDQGPFVDAARSLEQQRLRIDRYALGAVFRLDSGFEVEGTAGPREEGIDRILRVERPIDDRRVTDPAVVEVDRAETVVEREP